MQSPRFAIAAVDRYLGVFDAFVQAGWQPLALFTVPIQTNLDNFHAVGAYAEQHKSRVQLSRITEHDIHQLGEEGCDALIVAGYYWRIGDLRPAIKYGINFHASPLPEARGPYPMVRAILEGRDHWAVTCHKLEPKMDSGDILAAENFAMARDECHETLDLKIQMAARRLASHVASDFNNLWGGATAQTGGSDWPRWTSEERMIDFAWPVEQILRHLRAFGLIESTAPLGSATISIRRAVGWTESHNHPPGQVVHTNQHTTVVAARDGYIGILEWRYSAP